ncbi:hypothetical protein DO97_08750 [Neosynechococcus sphagnicola sy1]|uniref:Integral membrane protein n=1 Tax=Neosynechococcus sphagnicola sy1 TaxID=1497020 RepID=A0A098TIR5_9CYAN|nr:DUF2301 domain-containing membrane protein [Neosynechococcus sphagnicola]KGF72450.1 hypothetical protein DO97_08750 [Neosynechococcus sphagnicola sy1]
MTQSTAPTLYQGQFGEYTITQGDRRGVVIYRISLGIAALSFALGTGLALWQSQNPGVLSALTGLYGIFCLALGVSLLTIHIYMAFLHRLLQLFWVIGVVAAGAIALLSPTPLVLTIYHQPLTLLGVGFTFAALTGIFFKEAVCFNRLETKFLTPMIPLLLLGHWSGLLSLGVEQKLLGLWAGLFVIFALRKAFQDIPADIGDKSVFAYLRDRRTTGTVPVSDS